MKWPAFIDAGAATKLGNSLGMFFAKVVLTRVQANPEGSSAEVASLFRRAEDLTRGMQLNSYQQYRLTRSFAATLLRNNIDAQLGEQLTQQLAGQLQRQRHEPVAAPSSKLAVDADEVSFIAFCQERVLKGKPAEAVACYRRATEVWPESAVAHFGFGTVLYSQGRLEEAEQAFAKAVQIDPGFGQAHSNRALMLLCLGEFDRSEAAYLEALRIDPNNSLALVGRGQLASLNGEFTQAEELYRRALEQQPKDPIAWAKLVDLRKMTVADSSWLANADKIARSGLQSGEEADLRFAMGKFCDDTKDFDRAFSNYRRANELRQKTYQAYDPQKMVELVDRLSATYDRAAFANVRGASDSSRPVMVLGMMRSGTSLVEQVIASHPEAFGAGELTFWTQEAASLEKAREAGAGPGTGVARDQAKRYLGLLASLSTGARKVVDKAPANFLHIGLIHSAFPRVPIIHTLRHPIDTCLSIYFQNFPGGHGHAINLEHLAHYYRQYVRLMEHWHAVLPAGAILDVPYETFLNEPDVWIKKIVAFAGLEWDERCLNFQDTKRRVASASNWQVRQKLFTSSRERWRHYEKHIGPLRGLLDLQDWNPGSSVKSVGP